MDPLRLPTVPPPAPATHPWRDRALIAIVAVLLPVMATVDPLRGAAIRWEQRRAAFSAGDLLFLYSDGVADALGGDDDCGEEAILELLRQPSEREESRKN